MGNFKTWSKIKLSELKRFIYNREKSEFLGRTPLSWAQLLLFFAVFFTLIGAFFAIHLAVFLAITPSPGSGVAPWNFGKYAYPNYPNSKIEMISIPDSVRFDDTRVSFPSGYKSAIDGLLEAAAMSGVTCMNSSNNYGFVDGKSCILIRMAKTFEWQPSSIQQFLPLPVDLDGDYLKISCSANNAEAVNVTTQPSQGLPLNIPNNNDGRSFPYQNQGNYTHPVVGVIIEKLNTTTDNTPSRVSVKCGVDLEVLGISNWSSSRLSKIYEIPKDVTITVRFNR